MEVSLLCGQALLQFVVCDNTRWVRFNGSGDTGGLV
jgi:hypothetical protein